MDKHLDFAYGLRDELDGFADGERFHSVSIAPNDEIAKIAVSITDARQEPAVLEDFTDDKFDVLCLNNAMSINDIRGLYFEGKNLYFWKVSESEFSREKGIKAAVEIISKILEAGKDDH